MPNREFRLLGTFFIFTWLNKNSVNFHRTFYLCLILILTIDLRIFTHICIYTYTYIFIDKYIKLYSPIVFQFPNYAFAQY